MHQLEMHALLVFVTRTIDVIERHGRFLIIAHSGAVRCCFMNSARASGRRHPIRLARRPVIDWRY
jgi:hypothetical protein